MRVSSFRTTIQHLHSASTTPRRIDGFIGGYIFDKNETTTRRRGDRRREPRRDDDSRRDDYDETTTTTLKRRRTMASSNRPLPRIGFDILAERIEVIHFSKTTAPGFNVVGAVRAAGRNLRSSFIDDLGRSSVKDKPSSTTTPTQAKRRRCRGGVGGSVGSIYQI